MNNRDKTVRAEDFDHVMICAGAIESAKLLLASRSVFWPKGIGNDADHVGRHLISHPRIQATGVLDSNPKAYAQELDFPTLECRHFDTPAHQEKGKFYFVRDDRDTTLDFAGELVGRRTPDELQKELLGPVKFTLSGFVEEFEGPGNRVELANGATKFGLPRTRILYATPEETRQAKLRHLEHLDAVLRAMGMRDGAITHLKSDQPRSDHAAGTTRMSPSAASGVVSRDLRVHDCDNVTVCSNGVLPTIGAVNPTLTLVALAIRMAESV
jgi:choline dehydrogenase-like flavoprotein